MFYKGERMATVWVVCTEPETLAGWVVLLTGVVGLVFYTGERAAAVWVVSIEPATLAG